MSRRSYTPENFVAMKRDLARRAIEYWVYEQANDGDSCLQGSAELGFEFATDHSPTAHVDPSVHPLFHHRYPPVQPGAGAQQTLVEYEDVDATGTLRGEVEDVWSTRYLPWFDDIDQVLEGWDALPDERDFWSISANVAASANPIEIDMAASQPGRVAGNAELARTFTDLWNARRPIWAGPAPTGTAPIGPGRGRALDVFYDTYAAGLDLVIGQQAVVLNLAASTARAEGDMWQRARATIMEIGDAAVAAMGPESLTEADVAAAINVLGDLANLGALFVGTPVAAFTGILGLLCDGLGLYWNAHPPIQPTPVERILAGTTASNVLDKLRDAVAELNRQVVEQELEVDHLVRAALDASYTPSDGKGVGVNLPPPQLLDETDPRQAVGALEMNYSEVRRAGAALRSIGSRLRVVPVGLDAYEGPSAWMRPPHIGVNGTGPHEAWSKLLARGREVTADTAEELVAAADHLELALDLIQHADDSSRTAFQQLLDRTTDVRAAEPTGPPPRDSVPLGRPRP